jgi:hypothetical protein
MIHVLIREAFNLRALAHISVTINHEVFKDYCELQEKHKSVIECAEMNSWPWSATALSFLGLAFAVSSKRMKGGTLVRTVLESMLIFDGVLLSS